MNAPLACFPLGKGSHRAANLFQAPQDAESLKDRRGTQPGVGGGCVFLHLLTLFIMSPFEIGEKEILALVVLQKPLHPSCLHDSLREIDVIF